MKMRIPINKIALLVSIASLMGCGPNEGVLKSGRPSADSSAATPARSGFEQDLSDMRDADYSFIYVLRRKDGNPLDPEDRALIRASILEVNRRVVSDDGRAAIIGTNFPVPPDKMRAIYDRFAVDNYSKTDAGNSDSAH